MAKRKQFDLGVAPRPEESGREIERLFDAELRSAQKPVLRDLPVDRIQPNPFQARQDFDGLDELVQSIQAHGFVSRLRVRPHPDLPDYFQLVFGERRLRAARAAGMQTIPCEIAEHSDAQLIEIGLAENIQRQDLDPLEEAYAFRTLIAQRGYTQQRLADRIGKDVGYVAERLHILDDTPPDVQEMVRLRGDTLRAAREIAKLPGAAMRASLIARVLDRTVSTRDVRELVRKAMEPAPEDPIPSQRQDGAVPAATTTAREDEQQTVSGRVSRPRDAAAAIGAQATSNPALMAGATLDRDIRNVRAIFERWQGQVDALDEPYLSRLIHFMVNEHLRQVEHLIQALEDKH